MVDDIAELPELAEHFLREVAQLHRKGQGPVDERAVLPLLDAWATLLEWSRSAGLDEGDVHAIVEAANNAAEAYGNYKRSTGETKGDALSSVRNHLDVFLYILDEGKSSSTTADETANYRAKIVNASEEAERLMSVLVYVTDRTAGLDQAVEVAKQAAHEAQQALKLAKKAVTEGATTKLERSFQTTATKNALTASWFRAFTIGTLGLTVVLGAWFAITHAPTGGGAIDWYGILYRLAVLTGMGAIAAYLGRQAGNYHRIAMWAQGIEIQLKAFLGFVNEIEDEGARQTLFALFGKRVLEAPPDGKSSSEDSVTNVIQPIFDQQ